MKTTKQCYIYGNPDISILNKIIQCFFNKEINIIEGLEISRKNTSDYLISNFENILPDLMMSYNHWKLKNAFEDLNFLRCINILKHYLYYFGFTFERKEIMIKEKYKMKKVIVYRIPFNYKKYIEAKGKDIFLVSFD